MNPDLSPMPTAATPSERIGTIELWRSPRVGFVDVAEFAALVPDEKALVSTHLRINREKQNREKKKVGGILKQNPFVMKQNAASRGSCSRGAKDYFPFSLWEEDLR